MSSRWSNSVIAAGVLIGFTVPIGGTYLMVMAIGVSIIALLLLFIRDKPNAILSFWILSVAIVPPWISFQFFGYRIPVAAIVSIGVVFVLLGRQKIRWNWCDSSVVALASVSIIATSFFSSPLHLTTQVLFEWVACYAAGRFVFWGADFPRVANRLGGLIGWLSVLQLFLKFNVADYLVFNYGNSGAAWMNIQERGGQIRSELTFGHSISLGATLCLLLPFALNKRTRVSDKIMLFGIALGIVATSSRSAMISGVVVLIIVLLTSKISGIMKLVGTLTMVLGAWVGLNLFLDRVSGAENSAELTDSTAYREGLLDLLSIVKLVGLAPGGVSAQDGVTFMWSKFYSIDNGILYVGLYLGWIAAACYLAGTVYVAWQGFRGNARPFAVAMIAQVPFILTVAPITQYQNYYWMILGAGVSAVTAQRSSRTRVVHDRPPVSRSRGKDPILRCSNSERGTLATKG